MVQLSPRPGAAAPSPSGNPVSRLSERIRTAGAGPLLTWYGGGARVELSTRTVGTWVAKTVHLMSEEGIGSGDLVHLGVLAERPLHWVSCCWLLACWWSGARPSVRPADAADAALQVSGPDASGSDPDVPLVQCSLTPLAGPCDHPVPGAIDFCEVLGMPDEMPVAAPAPPTGCWLEDAEPRSGRALAEADPLEGAVLLSAGQGCGATPYRLAALLSGVLAGGGSLVLVESAPAGLPLAELARQERARPA